MIRAFVSNCLYGIEFIHTHYGAINLPPSGGPVGARASTKCYIVRLDEQGRTDYRHAVITAMTFCSQKDQFCRTVGRGVALSRVLAGVEPIMATEFLRAYLSQTNADAAEARWLMDLITRARSGVEINEHEGSRIRVDGPGPAAGDRLQGGQGCACQGHSPRVDRRGSSEGGEQGGDSFAGRTGENPAQNQRTRTSAERLEISRIPIESRAERLAGRLGEIAARIRAERERKARACAEALLRKHEDK